MTERPAPVGTANRYVTSSSEAWLRRSRWWTSPAHSMLTVDAAADGNVGQAHVYLRRGRGASGWWLERLPIVACARRDHGLSGEWLFCREATSLVQRDREGLDSSSAVSVLDADDVVEFSGGCFHYDGVFEGGHAVDCARRNVDCVAGA
jgi:hypothetical protein